MNEDYAVRNTHATLYQVRERLGNTYVCSSDNYFTENPFEPYAYESFCAAVYVKGETDEYCLRTRGRERRIVAAVPGGQMCIRDRWRNALLPMPTRSACSRRRTPTPS